MHIYTTWLLILKKRGNFINMPIREHDNFKMKKIIDKFLSKIFLGVGFVGASMAVGAVMDEHMKSEDQKIRILLSLIVLW